MGTHHRHKRSSRQAARPARIERLEPRLLLDGALNFDLAGVFDPGFALTDSVALRGDYAYMVDPVGELAVFDVSDPTFPQWVTVADTSIDSPARVDIAGRYAYVSDAAGTMDIFDLAVPDEPQLLISYTGWAMRDMEIVGDYAYIVDSYDLLIYNVADPFDVYEAGQTDGVWQGAGIDVWGDTAYIADSYGMLIYNVADPADPQLLGTYDGLADASEAGLDVMSDGTYAYLAGGAGGFHVLDVTVPYAPSLVGFHDTGYTRGVRLYGQFAIVQADQLIVLDVSSPTGPARAGVYAPLAGEYDLAIDGRYAYLGDDATGLTVLEINDAWEPPINAPWVVDAKLYAPDFHQQSVSYPNFGYMYGLAAALADGIVWMSESGYDLLPGRLQQRQIVEDLAAELATDPLYGTPYVNIESAMERYIGQFYLQSEVNVRALGAGITEGFPTYDDLLWAGRRVEQNDTFVVLLATAYDADGLDVGDHAMFFTGYDLTEPEPIAWVHDPATDFGGETAEGYTLVYNADGYYTFYDGPIYRYDLPWLGEDQVVWTGALAVQINDVQAGIDVVTTAADLHRTAEQVYAIRWSDSGVNTAADFTRVELFHNTDPLWDPSKAAPDELAAHRFTELADVPVRGSVARKARLDGTVDDGLWVRLEDLVGVQGNYVFAAVVNELTAQMLAWDRSTGRLVIDQPIGAGVEVVTTRLPGGFNKSVAEAAWQDPNGKATYVIRWSDANLPAGATIDIKFGTSSVYSDLTTDFTYGWGAGTSGGGAWGNRATGIPGIYDGEGGDSFKWHIGDDLRVRRDVGYYMWVVLRDALGNLLTAARSTGSLTIIS